MKQVVFIVVVTIVFGVVQVSSASSVDNAYKFCSALDSTGMLSKQCEVSSAGKSINVTMNTSENEAQKICRGITAQASQVGARFESGWKVKIYPAYGSSSAIA